jgi:hypothetical protein
MPGVDYLLDTSEEKRLPVTETSRGTYIIHGKKVFRAGTFKDSRGVQRTWTTDQLDQMVANFHALRTTGALVGVPLRVDHSFSARDLVGWISDLYLIGEYVHADLHFTEPDAYRKWQTGTYEPVSAEVAPYETNNGDIFTPTLIGVAFVDIPAVEGLYRASGVAPKERVTAVPIESSVLDSQSGSVYERGQEAQSMTIKNDPDLAGMTTAELTERFAGSAVHQTAPIEEEVEEGVEDEDSTVGDASSEGAADEAEVEGESDGDTEAAPVEAGDLQVSETEESPVDPAVVTAALGALDGVGPPSVPEVTEDEADDDEDAAEAESAASEPPAVHGSPVGQVASFRVNGVPLSDPSVVQAHIDALEQFRSQTLDQSRRDFVTGLVRENKILAGQAEPMTDLALSMDDAQFSKFMQTFESASANPLLGTHGRHGGDAGQGHSGGQSFEKAHEEMRTLEEVVARLKMAGKSDDEIQRTTAYAKLTELKTSLNG